MLLRATIRRRLLCNDLSMLELSDAYRCGLTIAVATLQLVDNVVVARLVNGHVPFSLTTVVREFARPIC